jgi:hypothetical protein
MDETCGNSSLILLFSSNIRPLYEQDILDVLAAPEGVRYRFRYEDRYVSKVLLDQWGERLRGTSVLVLFSLQQEARYHDPVFFPVRRGVVRRAWKEAKYHFVEFIVGGYAALSEPPLDETRRDQRPKWDQPVKAFTKYLADQRCETPYPVSASIGPDIVHASDSPVDVKSDATVLFERTGRYLSRTDSFREARFVRFLRLVPEGARDEKALAIEPGLDVFNLAAGATYRLQILQAQPVDVAAREPFLVRSDGEIIKVIGREGFDIASRYDVIEVPIHARYHGSIEIRETVLVIEPGKDMEGPSIRLPLRVSPPEDSAA